LKALIKENIEISFAEGGHNMFVDNPKETLSRIREFFNKFNLLKNQ